MWRTGFEDLLLCDCFGEPMGRSQNSQCHKGSPKDIAFRKFFFDMTSPDAASSGCPWRGNRGAIRG